jgi:hypothetical protein
MGHAIALIPLERELQLKIAAHNIVGKKFTAREIDGLITDINKSKQLKNILSKELKINVNN